MARYWFGINLRKDSVIADFARQKLRDSVAFAGQDPLEYDKFGKGGYDMVLGPLDERITLEYLGVFDSARWVPECLDKIMLIKDAQARSLSLI